MNTRIDLFPPVTEPEIYEVPVAPAEVIPSAPDAAVPDQFADEQIRRLVRQVFAPGWPRPARHVVFSAVDSETYIAEICMDVGKSLAAQVAGSVCVVEANWQHPELEGVFARKEGESLAPTGEPGMVRSLCQHVSGRLWLAPMRVLAGEAADNFSAATLERRLVDLHLEFDYTVLHGPSAGAASESCLLGHMSDGVIMVLEAHRTRRAAAQKAKEMLQAGNVRVLGSILSGRTFPIPRGIYRRL